MVRLRIFLYTFIKVMLMDYIEIMSFCGYDLDRADEMVNEIVKNNMETLSEQSLREDGRGLHGTCDQRGAGRQLVRGL